MRIAAPELDDEETRVLEHALRRAVLAALLDRTTTGAEIAADLELLVIAHQARHRASR